MIDDLMYTRNKKRNRMIAIVITGLTAASQFVALPSVLNITVPLINKPLLAFLSSFGLIWVAYGLHKFKFGG